MNARGQAADLHEPEACVTLNAVVGMSCCAKNTDDDVDSRPKGPRASTRTVDDVNINDMKELRFQNPIDESSPEDVDALVDACTDGEVLTCKRLLEQGVYVDSQDPETGSTMLMIAAINGQKECVEILISHGAALEKKDPEFGMTAFLWACHSAHLRCVEILMKAGCDVEAREASGLNGIDLAKENMKLGWERVVDYIRDTYASTDGGQSQGVMNSSTDMEHEKQVSAARNRRMQKLVGTTNSEDAMQILLSSEKLDKSDSPANTPRKSAWEGAANVKHAAMARTTTSAMLAEAEVNDDKLATQVR